MTVTARDVQAARAAVGDRRAPHADPLHPHVLRARGRDGRAEGREPAAHRLVQGPRRRREARRARRRGLRQRRRRRLAPATTPRRSPPARPPAACRARSSSPPTRRWPRSRPPASSGAIVHVGGKSVDECLVAALERAETGGLAFVHPFDDPAIVAGQGSLGLELLEDVPGPGQGRDPGRRRRAVRRRRAGDQGRQAATCRSSASRPPPARRSRSRCAAGEPIEAKIGAHDRRRHRGQAPRRDHAADPDASWLDDMVVVGEDATAEAMALLLERCKLVVEGAGAVGVAALLGGQVKPADDGVTVAVLSGGNVDAGLLAAIARRHETESGRRLVAAHPHPRPAGRRSPRCWPRSPATGANIVDVSHVREGLGPARARDRGRAGARDARPRPRAARARPRSQRRATRRRSCARRKVSRQARMGKARQRREAARA